MSMLPLLNSFLSASDAASFDGTNDYIYRNTPLDGTASDISAVFSGWIRTGDPDFRILTMVDDLDREVFSVFLDAGYLNATMWALSGGAKLEFNYTSELLDDSLWHHVIFAISGGNSVQLRVDDASVVANKTLNANTYGNIAIPAAYKTTIGNTKQGDANYAAGDMAYIYLKNSYLQIDQEVLRRTFITAAGKPAQRNADGSATNGGTQPELWFAGNQGAFSENKGFGGAFSVAGALTASNNTPIIIGT
jgi:hypothetical protein